MLLPSTYSAALLLTIISMLCWGSWANTFKLAGKWRFELFYYDYAVGVLLTATLAAFTFGSAGDDLSFIDNLMVAGSRKMVYGFAAGAIFNLANMLLVGAISIAGMAVAFPVGIGLALVVGVVLNYYVNPQANPAFLGAGVALVLGAIVVDALAYAYHSAAQHKAAAAAAGAATVSKVASHKRKGRKHSSKQGIAKGIVLSLISGVLMGSFYPLVEMGKEGELGLGPYAIAFVFALGVFVTTFLYNLFFLNLPIHGEPVRFGIWFSGTARQHLLGIGGGVIWTCGAIANFVAASAPRTVQVGPAVSYAIGQGATMVSALWGLLVWKEFAGASPRVRMLLGIMLTLFIGGLALVSMAPLFVR